VSQQEDLIMATSKKAAPRSSKTAAKSGAGAAIAEHTKDAKGSAGKAGTAKSFGQRTPEAGRAAAKPDKKPAAKTVAKTTARTKGDTSANSVASKIVRAVKDTASGAVSLAASLIGRDGKKAKSS
jgi:hypothetical protein